MKLKYLLVISILMFVIGCASKPDAGSAHAPEREWDPVTQKYYNKPSTRDMGYDGGSGSYAD